MGKPWVISSVSAICAHPFTFGVEEEFFLAEPRTGAAIPRVPVGLMSALKQRLGDRVGCELLQGQVETVTPVCHSEADIRAALVEQRKGLDEVCRDYGLRFFAAGTHPLGVWREQEPSNGARYEKLIDDFQLVGRRNLLCGLHVHVQPPEDVDRVLVINRVLPWLPLFLALSTSSPFWDRQRSGLMSYRQAAYDEWPRTGIPDFFDSEAHYNAYVATLVRTRSIADSSYVWWAIRPSLRYPTVELRIADSCTHVEDALVLALLFRCLVRAASRGECLDLPRDGALRCLIEENRWRSKRYAFDQGFIDYARGQVVPFREALVNLLDLLKADISALGHDDLPSRLTGILERGTSAHQQLACYFTARRAGASHVQALRAVVGWLIKQSSPLRDCPVDPSSDREATRRWRVAA